MQEGQQKGMQEGREKGIEAGLKKGREEEKKLRNIEIAKQMLTKNTDKKFISEVTGLSLEEIESCR